MACHAPRAFSSNMADGRTLDGDISLSGGGVGRNIADALQKLGTTVHFISAIGNDYFGQYINENTLDHLKSRTLVTGSERTPCCLVVCDREGNSRLLVGDMRAHKYLDRTTIECHKQHLIDSKLVVFDGNVPCDAIQYILDICNDHNIPVLFEPTDILKARIPFTSNLKTRRIQFITPNLDEFFEIVQQLMPNVTLLQKQLTDDKLKETACELVKDFVDNVILTLGADGILIARRGEANQGFFSCDPTRLIKHQCDVSCRLYTPPRFHPKDIVNVSGAGDCFASGFVKAMLQGFTEENCVAVGFKASQAALKSKTSVPKNF